MAVEQSINPIPQLSGIEGWENVPIEENDEGLVMIESLGCPRITVRPAYFHAGLPGAVSDQFVRSFVGEMLVRAAEALPDALTLVVMDAWRPLEVQEHLHKQAVEEFKKHQNLTSLQNPENFAARPSLTLNCPYPHSTGGAVDVTLIDEFGSHLDMGSDFDDFSPCAATRFYETGSMAWIEKRDNRRLLFHTMTKVGFTNYCNEWWHFDFGNQLWAIQNATTARYGKAAPAINTLRQSCSHLTS